MIRINLAAPTQKRWKREYEDTRRAKKASDPEYAARLRSQRSRTPEENREYMRRYYQENKGRWAPRTREQRDAYNATRREKYRTDETLRNGIKRMMREYGRAKPEIKQAQKMRRYGLTRETYNALLASQGGGCAICGATESRDSDPRTGKRRSLHIDHCHRTGRVRGLLCASCNLGLGKFSDDTERMRRAIEYLERSQRASASDDGTES